MMPMTTASKQRMMRVRSSAEVLDERHRDRRESRASAACAPPPRAASFGRGLRRPFRRRRVARAGRFDRLPSWSASCCASPSRRRLVGRPSAGPAARPARRGRRHVGHLAWTSGSARLPRRARRRRRASKSRLAAFLNASAVSRISRIGSSSADFELGLEAGRHLLDLGVHLAELAHGLRQLLRAEHDRGDAAAGRRFRCR